MLATTYAASLIPCPEHCQCEHLNGERFHATCNSFEILRKLQPKQARAIESFTLTNAIDIDPKIKNLPNLKKLQLSNSGLATLKLPPLPSLTHLNVSSNNLKRFDPSTLPRSLVNLDVSFNLLEEIPGELALLKNLQYVNVTGNPVYCSCGLVQVRNALKDANVIVNEPVVCDAPSHFKGVAWTNDEICPNKNIWDQMLGDEGSGSGDGDGDSGFVAPEIGAAYEDKIEDEFLTELHPANTSSQDGDYEGSGDDIENEFRNNPPKPCYMNCSTPPPLFANDTNNTISALDGARILFEDISGKKVEETTTTTTRETPHEKTVVAVSMKPLESDVPKDSKTEEINRSTTTAPSTAVAVAPKKSKSTYILLAVLCIVIVMIIVFAIYKTKTNRRNKKRRQTDADNGINKKSSMQEMTELAPLTKIPPEHTHLTNGTKNGKTVEPTEPKDDENYNDGDGVELRKKQESEALLTPEAKRVTIKAGEIPGSVPRTPLLVNRHISSDGNVVTIPSLDQRL